MTKEQIAGIVCLPVSVALMGAAVTLLIRRRATARRVLCLMGVAAGWLTPAAWYVLGSRVTLFYAVTVILLMGVAAVLTTDSEVEKSVNRLLRRK